MKKLCVFFLRIYQKTLSPDHGVMRFFYPYRRCKWYPTCSEYAITAIQQVGMMRGGYSAIKRIVRCHPWSQGGFDVFSEKK